ncbi:hypothetical protein F7725_005512, partial [Dissostichus mawsoni]
MDKVTIGEEVTRQELLPEPLLIILSPPPPFLPGAGKPTMFWHKWLKAFEHYFHALGENELAESSKCGLLRNCLGLEGQHIFTALIQRETSYTAVISSLTLYFCSDHTSQMCRLKFHQRAQMPGEGVDVFVSALEELLRPCNYGHLQDKLILDQLIEKTNCPPSKRGCCWRGKQVESAFNETDLFSIHEVSVDIEDDLGPPVPTKRKRGRPRRGEGKLKIETEPPSTKTHTRSSRQKDSYYYSNDKQYYSENDGDSDNSDSQDEECEDNVKDKDTEKATSQDGGTSWLEMRAHKKTHAVEGLTCLACDKQFKEKAALVSHLKLHKKVQAKPRSLTCGDCGKVFGRMYHLKRHIVTHRKASNGDIYTCPDCQKDFAFPEDLNKHLEIHLKENNGTCPKCDETFSSPEELEAHMGVHEKSYACSTCGKKFKVEYALKKHEQGHQDEQFYCSLCRKHFIKLSHYKRHMTVHDRRESRCPHCDSIFLQLTAFKYHLRTHTAERPYQCTCCIETFEEKKDLDQHCLRHRKFKKEMPNSCTRCDCAFSTLLELTDHMSSHDGEQPMTCPI